MITLDGTTGITTPDIDSTAGFDGEDLTGDVAAARITGALNATGSAPIYACRAWVNFDGTGTVAIRASGNVSSITDNGPGDYTVNFTTAMEDANYAVETAARATASNAPRHTQYNTQVAGSVIVYCIDTVGGVADPTSFSVAIFR